MKIHQKNCQCADTIHATIRMNKAEYCALREFMHTKDGDDIVFPYGTTIIKHGYGWYYMSPSNSNRALDKMAYAIKIIKMFLKQEEERVEAEIKALVPIMMNVDMQVVAFSAAHSVGEFSYATERQPHKAHIPLPASQDKLQRLAARFSKPH